MLKQFDARSSRSARKRNPDQLIRSAAFMRKSEHDIPRINFKAIPLHHAYGTQRVIEQKEDSGLNWNFWGCATGLEHKQKEHRNPKTERTQKTRSQSANLLNQYMRRRPTLTLIRPSFDFTHETDIPVRKTPVVSPNCPLSGQTTFSIKRTKRPTKRAEDYINTTDSSCPLEQEIEQHAAKLADQLTAMELAPSNWQTRRLQFIARRKVK